MAANTQTQSTEPNANAAPQGAILEAGKPLGPRALTRSCYHRIEDRRQHHVLELPAEFPEAEVPKLATDGRYHLNLREIIVPYDLLEIRDGLGRWVWTLRCAENLGNGLMRFVEEFPRVVLNPDAAPLQATGDWHCRTFGPKRWCIVNPLGRIVKEQFYTREAAEFEMRIMRGQGGTPRQHPAMG